MGENFMRKKLSYNAHFLFEKYEVIWNKITKKEKKINWMPYRM